MDSALVDETSQVYLGQWKRLVSTTNWEKGQIIRAWRAELAASGAPSSEFSDEAWARRVGNVTPQHVGRLRRVAERFAESRDQYTALYWSHFQAALDWDDAEMWLEGASQNGWSISEMRRERWQAMNPDGGEPPQSVVLEEPWDEDAETVETSGEVVSGAMTSVEAPRDAGDDDADFDHEQFDDVVDNDQPAGEIDEATEAGQPVRPFANLPPLPADVSDAVESFKLCIVRHRLDGWREISRDDMLTSLHALEQLVLAPAEA